MKTEKWTTLVTMVDSHLSLHGRKCMLVAEPTEWSKKSSSNKKGLVIWAKPRLKSLLVLHLSLEKHSSQPPIDFTKEVICIHIIIEPTCLIIEYPKDSSENPDDWVKTANLEDLMKITIPMTEEPPEVHLNWRERVHTVPSIPQALQDLQNGVFIIILNTQCPWCDGKLSRKNMFHTFDVWLDFCHSSWNSYWYL